MATATLIEPFEYPGTTFHGSVQIGDLGDSGEPAINTAAQYYLLHHSLKDCTVDNIRVLVDAVAGGEVYVKVWKLAAGDALTDLAPGDQIGVTLTFDLNDFEGQDVDLSAETDDDLRLDAGDSLWVSFDSISDYTAVSSAYESTTLLNARVAFIGRHNH